MSMATQTVDGAQLVNGALAAFQARERDDAAYLLAKALQADPPLGARWASVSRLAATMGEITLALAAARKHVAAVPTIEARLAYAQLLIQSGRTQDALREGAALARERPNDPVVLHFLATCQTQSGDQDAAIANLRRIIALPTVQLGAENAWHVLADIKKFDADDPDIPRMEAMLARVGTAEAARESRIVMLYALGKALDDAGQTDRAFDCFDTAAKLQKTTSNFNADQADAFVDAVVDGYSRAFIDSLPRSTVDSDRPIFVVGLPRSGTTLVEQILVSHSQVVDGAEANLFRPAAMAIKGYTPDEIRASFDRPDAATLPSRIAKAYLHLVDERFGKTGRVVDKTLNQTRYLGLIHQVLPKAKLIWLRRAPAGVAWSCYRTRFARGVDWTRSLSDIAHHFRGEDRLHAHWSAVLGDSLLTVPYEALVDDPETWMRRIIEHVGLEWEEGVRDFHKTERAVTTASFAQVRKPMYASSKEAWKRYEAHLKPFFDAYGEG